MRQAGFRAHNPEHSGLRIRHARRPLRYRHLAPVGRVRLRRTRCAESRPRACLCRRPVHRRRAGLRLAIERPHQVAGLALVSTTLAYDGWQMPWYRVLAPLAYHTPLRRMIAWPERHPVRPEERAPARVGRARHGRAGRVGGRRGVPAAVGHPRGAPADPRGAARHRARYRADACHACHRGRRGQPAQCGIRRAERAVQPSAYNLVSEQLPYTYDRQRLDPSAQAPWTSTTLTSFKGITALLPSDRLHLSTVHP